MKASKTPDRTILSKVVCAAAAAVLGCGLISSCNTVAGFGADLQKLGGKMENKAAETGGSTPPAGY